MREKIDGISFPNTVKDDEANFITVGSNGVTEIVPILKSGEMSGIQWFQIYKGDLLVAEIKESVCNVFYKEQSNEKH